MIRSCGGRFIVCMQANVIWNILGYQNIHFACKNFLLKILINLIKGPILLPSNYRSRLADVDFIMRLGLPANMPRKQAQSPRLLPWKRVKAIVSTTHPGRQHECIECIGDRGVGDNSAQLIRGRKRRPTSGQIKLAARSWRSTTSSLWFIAAELLSSVKCRNFDPSICFLIKLQKLHKIEQQVKLGSWLDRGTSYDMGWLSLDHRAPWLRNYYIYVGATNFTRIGRERKAGMDFMLMSRSSQCPRWRISGFFLYEFDRYIPQIPPLEWSW